MPFVKLANSNEGLLEKAFYRKINRLPVAGL